LVTGQQVRWRVAHGTLRSRTNSDHHNGLVTESDEGTRPESTGPERTADNDRRLFWLIIGIAVAVVLADQLTKWWAVAALTDAGRKPFIGDLISLQLTYNSGAAFSFATQSTWVFTIIAAAAVIVACYFAWRVGSAWWALALGLLLGGAATHLGDRLFRPPAFGEGHVVDFINYAGFFIGNVADIAIFCGAVLLLVLTFTGVRLSGRPDEPPAEGPEDA
jgi:signal peptidase II